MKKHPKIDWTQKIVSGATGRKVHYVGAGSDVIFPHLVDMGAGGVHCVDEFGRTRNCVSKGSNKRLVIQAEAPVQSVPVKKKVQSSPDLIDAIQLLTEEIVKLRSIIMLGQFKAPEAAAVANGLALASNVAAS